MLIFLGVIFFHFSLIFCVGNLDSCVLFSQYFLEPRLMSKELRVIFKIFLHGESFCTHECENYPNGIFSTIPK